MILKRHYTQKELQAYWEDKYSYAAFMLSIFQCKCKYCGRVFYTRLNTRTICNRKKCHHQKEVERWKKRKAAEHRPQRYCEACGEPLTDIRKDAKYCNKVCKQRAYRQRKAEKERGTQNHVECSKAG